jgi:putative acetyltransferase
MSFFRPKQAGIRKGSRALLHELVFWQETLRDFQLTQRQSQILIETQFHQEIQVEDLLGILATDLASLASALEGLSSQGWIRTADFQVLTTRVEITESGTENVEKLEQRTQQAIQELLNFLDKDEQSQVVEGLLLLGKARERLQKQKSYQIRKISAEDNPEIANVIRKVMTEMGASGPGFAIHDPTVDSMYESYQATNSAYYVVSKQGRVVGGAGFAPLVGTDPEERICELQKMYFYQEARGFGLAHRLLDLVLKEAKQAGYKLCYLETFETMTQAQRLYRKTGFRSLTCGKGTTGHFACNAWYEIDLQLPPRTPVGSMVWKHSGLKSTATLGTWT